MIQKISFNLALLLLPTFIMAAPPVKEIPLSSQATTLKIPFNCVGAHEEPIPKLTVIFVADGVPSASIDKVDKFLTGGIKSLRNRGVRYLNVFHPHANCSTAQGHASLTTGTFPIYHGIVNNNWLDANGQLFLATQDNDLATAGVFDPVNGLIYNLNEFSPAISFTYPSGVSPRNYKVDNLSDQLILFSTPEQNTKVFAIGAYSDSATLMAGRLGKALWIDTVTGLCTTSRYYFPNGIPDWVQKFNQTHSVPSSFVWESRYPVGSQAYNFPEAQNYQYSIQLSPPFLPFTVYLPNQTLFGQTIESVNPLFGASTYVNSPLGVKKVFDLAKETIRTQLGKGKNEHLVLWLNTAIGDLIGGFLGTQTQDALDAIYHIDVQLGDFIQFVKKRVPASETLFVFCNDEGLYPSIPEVLQQQGFNLAMRTISNIPPLPLPNLVSALNTALGTPYVQKIIPPFLYLDLSLYNPLTPIQQAALLEEIKNLLRGVPGIKDAWTFDELISWPFEREDQGRFFKLHLCRNNPSQNPPQERRSGEIIFQSLPFNLVTPVESIEPFYGTDHTSCYNYDSHSPLYIYQKGRFEKKSINTPVFIQQVAITLAEILHVPRPSAASMDIAPLPFLIP